MVIDQNNDSSNINIHKDQLNRQLQVMAIRTHMQVYDKGSPCDNPTDCREPWRHWLEINLAWITFGDMYIIK